MREFRLRVMDEQGNLTERRVQASDEASARAAVAGEGVQVLGSAPDAGFGALRHRPSFDVTLFAHELATLLQAGLSLVETLETLAQRETRRRARGEDQRVLTDLITGLKQGLSFSAALAKHPEVFPALFVSTVAASEQTGDLAVGLQRYLRHDEQVSALRSKIVSAALYPVLLLLVGGSVALFLLVYLVPRFSGIYENLDGDIPLASRLLMQWGAFANEHLLAVLISVVIVLVLAVHLLTRPATRHRLLLLMESNRWIGERVRLVRLSRFYRALGLLLRGGIPLVKALQVTGPLLTELDDSAVRHVTRGVSEGRALSDCLDENNLSTEVSSRLVRAGERNGQVADMLERTAQFHDEEVTRWLERVMKLFEPVLMAAIGLVIGAIVVLLYLPIFELAGSLE